MKNISFFAGLLKYPISHTSSNFGHNAPSWNNWIRHHYFRLMSILIFMLTLVGAPGETRADSAESGTSGQLTRPLVIASSNNFPPVNMLDEHGELTGFARDLSSAVAKTVGVKISYIHSDNWTQVQRLLEEGKADLIHDAGYTEDRDLFLDYTNPIFEMPETIFVRKKRFDIDSFQSLNGRTIACVNKHITHLFLNKYPGIHCHVVNTPAEALASLITDEVDAFIYPKPIAEYMAHKLGWADDIKIIGEPVRTLSWAMTVKEGNNELVKLLNRGLSEVRSNGEYDRIYNKWFGRGALTGYSQTEVIQITSIAVGASLMFGLIIGLLFHNQKLRRAHSKVRRSEAKYKILVENLPQRIFLKDKNLDYVSCNRNYAIDLGIQSEEIAGKSDFDLHPEAAEIIRADDREVMRTGTTTDIEEYYTKNGKECAIHTVKTPVYDENGYINGVLGIFWDITERKKAEVSLQKLNGALTTLMESRHALLRSTDESELLNKICHVLVDTGDYRFAWVAMAEHDTNKTVRPVAYFGLGDNYLSGLHISWADNKYGCGPTGTAIRTGKSQVANDIVNELNFETWRDSAVKSGYASSIALPLKIDNKTVGALNIYAGKPYAFNTEVKQLLEDLADDLSFGITALRTRQERDLAQNTLASVINQRALIMESIPDIVYQLNMGYELVMWNKRLIDVTGYSREELKDKHALEFFPVEEQQKIIDAITQIMEIGNAEVEANLLIKDNKLIPYQFSGTQLKNASGEVIGITGVGRDLSERKKAEAEKTQLQRQLQQAQKMEAIGQLTGGIAHDFNNILGSIMGYTDLAQEKSRTYKNEKLQEYLRQVMRASERARDMVAQMLAFSRGSESELNPHALQPLIKESIKMLKYTLPSSIELRTNIQPDVPQVMVDPVQLSQTIVNLCINSRDAMNGKGVIELGLRQANIVNVECTSCNELLTGNHVELFVTDTGLGIDAQDLPRIFEPFFSTKEVGKGTGMGLAMVHNIVHHHKGHLHVESTPNVGTSVRLFFPQASDQDSKLPKKEQKHITRLVPNKQANILVLDDEAPLALLEGEFLKDQGYAVSIFTDSQEALKHFEARPKMFDLVLTDYTMPGLTGVDIAQKMLKIRHELPIILCTGYSVDVNEEWITAIGIKGYFRKPIDHQDLFKTVHRLLAHSCDY